MLVSNIYPKIITFHIELNNGQTVIRFYFMLFFYIIKNPHPSNAILYYLLDIYILLRIHICLHDFASFLSYIQISDFDLNISSIRSIPDNLA